MTLHLEVSPTTRSFAVTSREEVNAWATRLDEHGVAHSGVVEMKTSPIVNFKDPTESPWQLQFLQAPRTDSKEE